MRAFQMAIATWLAWGALAGVAWAHGDLDDQIAAVSKQIDANPNNAVLYHQRGELERAHGDYTAAFADYDRAEQLDPELDIVQLSRGRSLLESNHADEAAVSLSKFLALHPGHYQALLLRARAYTRLARHEDAERDFGAALVAMTDPSPEVYLERAQNLLKAGQREDALKALDQAIRNVGQVVSLEQAALDVELELGRTDAALARIDSMLARSSRRETLLAKKAAVLEKAGRSSEARLAREEALAAIAHLPQSKRGGPTKRLQKQLVAALEKP
jgi:tetratricopeptide (TPR) repeat protein